MKKICGHCECYDMWSGVCLNHESKSFKEGREEIYDDEACSDFIKEASYEAMEMAVDGCCKAAYTWAVTQLGSSQMAEDLTAYIKRSMDK